MSIFDMNNDQAFLEIKKARNLGFWILVAGALFALFCLLTSCNFSNKYYVNEKFVIEDKGVTDYYFFMIRKLEYTDTLFQKKRLPNGDYLFYKPVLKKDTLYAVISSEYKYQENLWWNRLYYSKEIGDTIILDKINKNKFWTKIK